MALHIKTAPTDEPVSLADANLQMRIDGSDENTLVEAYITAAREYCEGFQNLAYITQTWQLWLDAFPAEDFVNIPLPPLQSIVSIKYYDINDVEYTMSSSLYIVDDKSEPGRVNLAYGQSWPSTTLRPINGVCIEFNAGFGDDPEDVPQSIRQVILLLVAHWFENREPILTGKAEVIKELPFTITALLNNRRILPL